MSHITSVQAGLWLVEAAMEDFGVRGVVLGGARRAVIWDTLARPKDMEGVAELMPDLPLTVVYSHGDWDHVWGTSGLSRPPAVVVAHEKCASRFRKEIPATLRRMRRQEPGPYDGVRLAPPGRTFRGHLTLELGGLTLELHSLPGHTADSIVGFVPEWNVFLAGDAVETPLPFLNPDSPALAWAEGLERWAERARNAVVVPAHGETGSTELLRLTAAYLRALVEKLPPKLPPNLPPFYTRTHGANLEIARRW